MDITYRLARFEDLEEAERVIQEAGNELRGRYGRPPWPAPPSIAFPKFYLADDPAGLWVAEHGATIVGFGFGFSWMTGKFWFLSQLFVRPEAQGKGVGQALLSKTLMHAERNGARKTVVTTALRCALEGAPSSVSMIVPGRADAAMQALLALGFRIEEPYVLMASRPFGNWCNYLPRTPSSM
jgi:GNAT superfamily N-acetyltransferase